MANISQTERIVLSAVCLLLLMESHVSAAGPTVTVSEPTEGATITGNIVVGATVSPSSSSGYIVTFSLDGTTIIGADSGSPPYSILWDSRTVRDGQHTLQATARYSCVGPRGVSLCQASSPVRTIQVNNRIVDTIPPTVSIAGPAAGAVVGGKTTVTATASDNIVVSAVEFFADSATTRFAVVNVAPYQVIWNAAPLPNGVHTLRARAMDSSGNATMSPPVELTVDNTPPSVTLTAPSNGASLTGIVTVAASAFSNLRPIQHVQFQRDGGEWIGYDSTAPYTFNWDTQLAMDGAHTVTALAVDSADLFATSPTVNVTTSNGTDLILPQVTIVSPLNGSIVKPRSKVTIQANASDNSGVANVRFRVYYVDSGHWAGCGDDTTGADGYACVWRVPSGAGRSYDVHADVYDTYGNSNSATPVRVTTR